MKVLITGAAGFIGSALAKSLLDRGESVIGIDDFNDYYSPQLKRDRVKAWQDVGRNKAKLIALDFSEKDALAAAVEAEDIDRIVHVGAQAGVRYSLQNPAAYARSNLVGHLNLLELARQRDVSHMVYASSSSVYGSRDKVPFSVSDRVDHPVSLYAATKKADELMSESYSHLFRIPQTGLRFFTVYGPWGRPDMMMWIFTSKILAGEPIPVFNNGNMMRDFTYIDDIVAGVIAALDNPPADDGRSKPGGSLGPHAIYNIGNSKPEKLTDVITAIETACELKAVIDLKPMQPGDVPRTFADISAIKADLGYQPTTSIESGVPQFVDWYRSYHGA